VKDGEDLSPALKASITTAFNEGLRQLITSTHGIMPDNAIVLNVITTLCLARKQLGFTEEQTRDAVIAALNTNMQWAAKFGGNP
jgi:hypothetical protein